MCEKKNCERKTYKGIKDSKKRNARKRSFGVNERIIRIRENIHEKEKEREKRVGQDY